MPKTLKVRPRSERTRDDDSTEDPYSDELEGSSPSVLIDGFDVSESGEDGEMSELEEGDDGSSHEPHSSDFSSEDSEPDVHEQLSKVSFGELAKAQSKTPTDASRGRKRQRGADTSAETEAKLQALRDRLRELREGKRAVDIPRSNVSSVSRRVAELDSDATSDSDLEDDSNAADAEPSKRSKHAPPTLSSSKAVSRKRTVISSTKPASARARDPRFARVSGPTPSGETVSKNYAFLEEYRQTEIAALKERLGEPEKGPKRKASAPIKKKGEKLTEAERAKLKRELTRMESQQQARNEKQRLEQVMKKHKQAERERVAEGKNPFFLKKAEQKRLALVDKFEGMKSKQKDKAIERRRKKVASRERRNMPAERRTNA